MFEEDEKLAPTCHDRWNTNIRKRRPTPYQIGACIDTHMELFLFVAFYVIMFEGEALGEAGGKRGGSASYLGEAPPNTLILAWVLGGSDRDHCPLL